MASGALLSDLIAAIGERGRSFIGWGDDLDGISADDADLGARCETLLSKRGETSGTSLAAEILVLYQRLDEDGRNAFFRLLLERFGPDHARLDALAAAWRAGPSDALAADLHFASEPRRQELLRRLNRAPGGTKALVAMRVDLIKAKRGDAALAPVDRDFSHLLASWFNRGFLVLRRIDWSTPAIVLEKIIRYEAVHEIRDFPDLRLRIDPPDRRCYGFFHPALPDEPLIFVEVALTDAIPAAIEPLLDPERDQVVPERAKVAVFYSISNCQKGLAGISFGNLLIKQVVEELRREFPRIDTFVTLSPVPGFARWLRDAALARLSDAERESLALIETPGWHEDEAATGRLRKLVESLGATYLLAAKRPDGRPVDLVANFHIGNGARLERIDWLADVSERGLRDAAGLMVNYLYDLDEIERNHEAFADAGEMAAAASVRRLVRAEKPAASAKDDAPSRRRA